MQVQEVHLSVQKDIFAGKLIGDAGLRGFRVGDAQVSEKHCGFVINRGNASAAEIMELMRQVEDKVEENSESAWKRK